MTAPMTGSAYLDGTGAVLAFAHRGGAHHPDLEGLENTLTAFRHAVALGYTHLETDVHATRDGVLIAFHDNVLDRVTDQVGEIAGATFAEVRQARIAGREQIPTLAELFDACPDGLFNIDIKSGGAIGPLIAFLEERGAGERVLIGSWSYRRLATFRRLTRGLVATSASPAETVLFMLLPGRVADLLTRHQVKALQIPYRIGPLTVASTRFVRRLHAINKHVHVWTIDDPAEMEQLLDRGVDGLMTDRTDILKAVLQRRNLWRDAP